MRLQDLVPPQRLAYLLSHLHQHTDPAKLEEMRKNVEPYGEVVANTLIAYGVEHKEECFRNIMVFLQVIDLALKENKSS